MALLLFLISALQEQKAPEELTLQARWQAGKLETRVGTRPWTASNAELLEQLKAAGASPKTRLVLSIPDEVPDARVRELVAFLKEQNFARVERDDEAVVVVPAKPGKPKPDAPRAPPSPVTVELVHEAGDCPAYAQGSLCAEARHWRAKVERTSCAGRTALLKKLREEAAKEADPKFPAWATRPATVRADSKAPCGLVVELTVACEAAGFFETKIAGTADAGAKGPDPGEPPLAGKDPDAAPPKLKIGVRLGGGAPEWRVDRGPWLKTEAEWRAEIRTKKASAETPVLIDADPDLPWSVVQRTRDLLQAGGLGDLRFLAPPYPLDGPVADAPVTEAEALAFAKSLDQEFRDEKEGAIDRRVYREEIFRRALGATRLSIPMRVAVERMTDALSISDAPIREAGGRSPGFRFLGIQTVDGAPRPLFRILLPSRLDYVQYVLGKTGDGTLRIVDAHHLSSGELLSATTRSQFLGDSAFLEVMNCMKIPTPLDLALCMGKPGRMMELLMDEKPKAALEYYDQHAAEYKGLRSAHRLRIGIAAKVGVDEYCKAIDDFERDLPRDPSLLLLRGERALLRKDRDGGLAAVGAVAAATKDPYMHVLRAKIHLAAGEPASARESAEKATVEEPGLDQGWWMALAVALQQKDFAGLAKLLSGVEKALKFELPDLTKIDDYADFVKSPEYQAWMKSRKER